VLGDNHQHQLTCDIVDLDYTADGSRIVVGSAEGDMIMLDANLEPVGRPVFLGEYTRCTSAGPDNKTAFVLVGGAPGPASSSFEFADSMNGWALVDLDAGVVLRREEPGISLFWGRGPCRRMADAPPSAAPRGRGALSRHRIRCAGTPHGCGAHPRERLRGLGSGRIDVRHVVL
jgi:hypothetical protein